MAVLNTHGWPAIMVKTSSLAASGRGRREIELPPNLVIRELLFGCLLFLWMISFTWLCLFDLTQSFPSISTLLSGEFVKNNQRQFLNISAAQSTGSQLGQAKVLKRNTKNKMLIGALENSV